MKINVRCLSDSICSSVIQLNQYLYIMRKTYCDIPASCFNYVLIKHMLHMKDMRFYSKMRADEEDDDDDGND